MKIIIPGDAEAQPRLRSFYRGGCVRHYDPARKEKENLKVFLSDFLSREYLSYEFPKCPRVSFFFYCTIPSTMPKKLRFFAERGLLRKRTRPDCDNYIKLYFDCMNEILFEDDSHCLLGAVEKFYHKEPKTVIYLDEATEFLNMPADEMGRWSESCEWIREKMASPLGSLYFPYAGVPLSLDVAQGVMPIPPSCKVSHTQLHF
jgi:Holliday junction resolvase RusA-like endonuclease